LASGHTAHRPKFHPEVGHPNTRTPYFERSPLIGADLLFRVFQLPEIPSLVDVDSIGSDSFQDVTAVQAAMN
jgi:hypothetical protein